MKKLLCTLLVVLSVQAATFAFGIESTMTTIMNSWEGCHIDQVINRWGYPTEERNVAGHKLYVWKTERVVTTPQETTTKPHTDKKGRTYYTSSTYGGETEVYTSERILEVNDQGIVIRGQYSGNDLPFTFMGKGKEWLNPTYPIKK